MRRRIPSAIVIYVIAASVAVAGIFIWDQLSRPSPTLNLNDPAMRARAAAQSITAEPTVRHVRVDEATGRVVVEARSKHCKASAARDENRQYLATEGRLIVRLILHDLPELSEAEVPTSMTADADSCPLLADPANNAVSIPCPIRLDGDAHAVCN